MAFESQHHNNKHIYKEMLRRKKTGVPRVRERGVLRGGAWAARDQPGQPQGDEVGIDKVGKMINNDGDEDCDHNEDGDDDDDDFDDGGDERSEKLLVNNRQSTFDRQLDSGHLGRFGSQVCYFEINDLQ